MSLCAGQVRAELLQGSPVLDEARQRQSALQQQWTTLAAEHFSKDPQRYPPAVWNESSFMRSFCVVLACTTYLPSAECFALVPVACSMGHTGNDNGCTLDYDADSGTVKVITTRPYRWAGRGGVAMGAALTARCTGWKCACSSWQDAIRGCCGWAFLKALNGGAGAMNMLCAAQCRVCS